MKKGKDEDGMATVIDRFTRLSREHRETPALVSDARSLTFGELWDRATRTGEALRLNGIRPGMRLGLAGRDGVELAVELLGSWLAGAVAVPIDFRAPRQEIARLAAEFDLGALLADKQHPDLPLDIIVRDAAWANAIATADPSETCAPDKDADAVISLTSGTTGRPAGIVLSHSEFLNRITQHQRTEGGPGSFAHCGLMSFSAIRHHVFAHLIAGNTVHMFPPLMGPGEFIERLQEVRATYAFVVPAMLRGMLAEAGAANTPILPHIKCLWNGGAGLQRHEKLESHHRLTHGFLHCFSSSVTGTCSTLQGDDLVARPETDGRIVPGIGVEIVDETDRVLPFGEVGLLRVRSGAMATRVAGSLRQEGDRVREGWAYTGDLARRDAAFLTIIGRSADTILRGGATVYPSEIEAVLSELSGVRECAVIGFPSERVGEEIAAFVATDGTLREDDIVAHCRDGLAPDKRPRRIVFVEALPRNANGKILKRDLTVEDR